MRINNKKILLVIAIVLAIILIIILITAKSKNSNSKSNYSVSNSNIKASFESVENDLKQAIEKCNQGYNEYREFGEKYFSVFFNTEYINKYLEKGKLASSNDIEGDDSMVTIYDADKKEIEDFPENISYKDSINIEKANTTYLIKYRSNEDSNNYYYLITIDSQGSPRLEFVCFTTGEVLEPELEIENF